MKTSELRQRFLQYFERQGHRRVASSAVIGPADDPTVMWTNSGMIQFKDVFLGKEKRDYSRATTSQKCLRAGGKHNDLDQVGFTARHHTFFEMLGNFSFGDYFKADAIRFAWEFVTGPVDQGNLGLDPAHLWVTVFEGADGVPADTEAEELWKAAGVRPDRIMRFGKKDNFWQMGDTGPCGPCSEMHYDRGAHLPGDATPNGEGDRVMEIWNLVFMQYERDAKGVLTPLPRPSIDTGMGLERTASILQGVDTNYEIDLFEPIFEAIWKAAKVKPEDRREHTNRTASQVIADHIRAATFMCFDGVVPSNEGRGYVLRKIVRRALRFGRKLGIEGLFFADLAPAVAQAMGDQYPELLGELPRIQKSLHREERQFSQTLSTGLKVLEASDVSQGRLAGSDIFRLYDTYGFPVDLVEDWCRERGIAADLEGFQQELNAQRTRARAAMKAHDLRLAGDLAVLADLPPTTFTGYDHLEGQAHVVALFDAAHRRVKQLSGEGYVLLDRTPFYAQSGGQVGDTGQLRFEGGHAEVLDCTAPAQKRHLHKVEVAGLLLENASVNALVHPIRRRRVRAHHTATHLLHAALREVLGTHVKQAGSVVDENRLRFDFTHFAPLEPEQIAEIERLASRQALASVPTRVNEMDIEEALASGAMALFGEKYGDVVRVVQVPGFSTELCGGTHVANTGEIGVVKIVSEGAVAAGVRRIEAVAGEMALDLLQADEAMIHGLSRQANAAREALPELLTAKDQRIAQLERELKEAKLKAASGGGSAEQVEQVKGITLVTAAVEGLEGNALREFMDQVRTRHSSAIIVLASKAAEDKVAALVSVSPDLAYDAGALFKTMLPALNGRGGGRKDLAQGGGTNPAGLPEAFAALRAAL
ncbi:alanine--tRNA ligase [Geothrix edaphica]|uniref:Alanine--tRNA ligase n=1 Tax=Geothrix edaphica TaxID=2927976 RepID=A0ABQ5Q0Y8_9BACT|nr:alanine--tRNA ligase [Geothrix edaphica]GLH68253.1 alanine--tRNA ligase [Geothrix edaphica]